MQYDYLFCATCGVRRVGHGHLCTVCGRLLRRPTRPSHHTTADVASLPSLVRVAPAPAPAPRPEPTRQPVAA